MYALYCRNHTPSLLKQQKKPPKQNYNYMYAFTDTHGQRVDIVVMTDDKDYTISEEYARCPGHQLIRLHWRGL